MTFYIISNKTEFYIFFLKKVPIFFQISRKLNNENSHRRHITVIGVIVVI